jgi:Sulfotransferase domain
MRARLPDFFIVGTPKAGTTSLYHYLGECPGVYMSPIKEPCYFAAEMRLSFFDAKYQAQVDGDLPALRAYLNGPMTERRDGGIVSEWEDYLNLFRNAGAARAVGEARVCYLWSRAAPELISSAVPNARIIMILRDPVERAFSQYLHGLTNGLIHGNFAEQIDAGLRGADRGIGPAYPFLEFGLYRDQVRRYLSRFPPENIRIYDYAEYNRQPERVLADIFHLLGITARPARPARVLEPHIPRSRSLARVLRTAGTKAALPSPLRHLARRVMYKSRPSLQMPREQRDFLRSYYRDDVAGLSDLLKRDFGHWLLPVERTHAAAAG